MPASPSRQHKDRPRLGRGLSSLLGMSQPVDQAEVTDTAAMSDTVTAPVSQVTDTAVPSQATEIAVSQVEPNPHQPRREFDEASLSELAASLKSTGLIQPIVVRPIDGVYQLIAGERRLRAAKLAGLERIPAIIRDVDRFTQAQMALVENIQRQDLDPLDRAQAYRLLVDQLGLTQAELAGRLGEDRSSVANFLRLLDLAEPVKQLLRDRKLSVGHAKLLAGLADKQEQQRLAEMVVSQDLSVRNLERVMQQGVIPHPSDTPAASGKPVSAHIADLEKAIARQLGMRVQVRSGSKGRGRLVVHYGSLDQFDDLMNRLGVSVE